MEGKLLIVSVSSGCFGQLWTLLEERLHFSSQYMIESYSDGVLNFEKRRRDVLLRPSVISSDDVDKFYFTFPIANTWYELYLKDSDEINSSNSYIRNCSMSLWVSTSAMILLFTVLIYAMLHVSSKYLKKEIYVVPVHEQIYQIVQYFSCVDQKFYLAKDWRTKKIVIRKLKGRNERSLGNCFIAAIAGFCSQGVYLNTNITSIRILVFSFLIFGMIIFNAYSALLVSQLTLGDRFLPFDTLEEIPEKGQAYSLCVRPESYPYLYFTVNNTREVQKKWKDILNKSPCPQDGVMGSKEMCEPYVAFLETPAVTKQYLFSNSNCQVTNLKRRYFNVDLSLMILKGLEDKAVRELNMEILRYREVGILSHLREKWI